jgi:hypothetical protein
LHDLVQNIKNIKLRVRHCLGRGENPKATCDRAVFFCDDEMNQM